MSKNLIELLSLSASALLVNLSFAEARVLYKRYPTFGHGERSVAMTKFTTACLVLEGPFKVKVRFARDRISTTP